MALFVFQATAAPAFASAIAGASHIDAATVARVLDQMNASAWTNPGWIQSGDNSAKISTSGYGVFCLPPTVPLQSRLPTVLPAQVTRGASWALLSRLSGQCSGARCEFAAVVPTHLLRKLHDQSSRTKMTLRDM